MRHLFCIKTYTWAEVPILNTIIALNLFTKRIIQTSIKKIVCNIKSYNPFYCQNCGSDKIKIYD